MTTLIALSVWHESFVISDLFGYVMEQRSRELESIYTYLPRVYTSIQLASNMTGLKIALLSFVQLLVTSI